MSIFLQADELIAARIELMGLGELITHADRLQKLVLGLVEHLSSPLHSAPARFNLQALIRRASHRLDEVFSAIEDRKVEAAADIERERRSGESALRPVIGSGL
jgi:hypothetical protein